MLWELLSISRAILLMMILCIPQCTNLVPTVQAGKPPPPPDPEPHPKLPPDYQPPPMTEEWQIEEFDWEAWYWMNLANDYLNHRLNPVQEQILLDEVRRANANNPYFQGAEMATIMSMARNLDREWWFANHWTHGGGVVMR